MRRSQDIALKQSEARERLNAAIEKRNGLEAGAEVPAELTKDLDSTSKELRQLEVDYRAAVIQEDEEDRAAGRVVETEQDAEAKEVAKLEKRASLSNYVMAAADGKNIQGAEAEFTAALKLGEGQVPLQMFAPEVEERQTTDTDTTITPRRWVDRLFADTAAQYLGLTFDTASPGTNSYPVTTGGGTPIQRGREEAVDETDWTIGVETLDPTRMSLHYKFTIEDQARLPGLEDALQRDMRAAMTERVDYTIFAGDANANEDAADIGAFFAADGIGAHTIKNADKAKADKLVAIFASMIDGLHANSTADLKVVASVPFNTLMLSTIANAAAENQTLAAFLAVSGITWRTRAGIAANANAGSDVAAIGLGRGQMGAGVVAMWPGGTLVRDVYSGARSGEVLLTLHTLWNFGLVRPSNFAKLGVIA